ncbi:MAG TPA: LPS export ABC transporter periplasmic protein LptC [bacterium]
MVLPVAAGRSMITGKARRHWASPSPGMILIALMAMAVCTCEEEEFTESPVNQFPHITLMKFSLTETKNGKKLWVLDADEANVFDEFISVDTVTIRFFDEKPEAYAVLRSLSGTLNTKTRNIIVRDSVRLLTSDSTRLFTDSLFWKNDSQKIITNSYVRIVKQDSTTIEGNGLITTPDLKKIEVIGAITGTSPVEFPKIR